MGLCKKKRELDPSQRGWDQITTMAAITSDHLLLRPGWVLDAFPRDL